MAGAVGASFAGWRAVHEPIGLRDDEQIAAASWEIAIGHSATGWTLRSWAILYLLGAEDFGDSGLGESGIHCRAQSFVVVPKFLVYIWSEIYVAAVNARDARLSEVKGFERLLDAFLHFGQMEHAGIGAGFLHVFWHRNNAVIGA